MEVFAAHTCCFGGGLVGSGGHSYSAEHAARPDLDGALVWIPGQLTLPVPSWSNACILLINPLAPGLGRARVLVAGYSWHTLPPPTYYTNIDLWFKRGG